MELKGDDNRLNEQNSIVTGTWPSELQNSIPITLLYHCWVTAASYSITSPGEEQKMKASCISLMMNIFQAWYFKFPVWKTLHSQRVFALFLNIHQCLFRKIKILSLCHTGHNKQHFGVVTLVTGVLQGNVCLNRKMGSKIQRTIQEKVTVIL